MSFIEIFYSSISNFARNKMRTFLTILGIIVSINAAIIIHFAGGSLNKSIESSIIGNFNTDLINVSVLPDEQHTHKEGTLTIPDSMKITDELIREYEKFFDGKVEAIYCFSGISGRLKSDNDHYSNLEIQGVNNAAKTIYDSEILYGRFISDKDCEEMKNTIVLSDITARLCFGYENAVGEYVYIKDNNDIMHQFVVVGIYKYIGEIYNSDSENMSILRSSAFITYTYLQDVFPDYENNNDMQSFNMVNISDVDGFKKLSNEFFKKRLDDPNWKTEVTLMSDDINYIVDIITLLTYIITIIAVASMIIGGIGIMNITIVNINERTREIGIKKAVGAGNSWIIFEFLTEAVLMSLSGALIGVVTGIISSFNIANIIKIICKVNEIKNIQVLFYIPYSIIVFSIFFSIITGIIFGIIPALKTTKMNVIDALRME